MAPRRPATARPRATIREVAERAGVSIGTVSRALNRVGRVSPTTSAAVHTAAAQLGYAPDAGAQSLRTRRSGVVGLLLSELSNPYSARIVGAIESRLQQAGYALLLANTHDDPVRERAMIEFYRRRRVDGLVLGACGSERLDTLAALRRDGIPAIALDRDLGPDDSGVQADYFDGTLQATRYLLNLGHRRIAMLVMGSTRRPSRERIEGYRTAFAERGLAFDPKLIRDEHASMEYAFSVALALFSASRPPTAIICMSSRTLAGVLHGVRQAGRSVPDDVSIVGIGDTDLSQLYTPAITSLTWDYEAVGNAVGELLLKRLPGRSGNAQVEPERLVVKMQFVLRESCGPVGAAARAPVPAARKAARAGKP